MKKIKMKKGYKVLNQRNKQLWSLCSMNTMYMNSAVRYVKDMGVQPKQGYGPLAVFETYKDAELLAYTPHTVVYECLYEPSNGDSLYELFNGELLHHPLKNCPEGTKLAKKVIITKRIGE